MLAPTHGVFGISLSLILLAAFGIQASLHWTLILASLIGSLLPDIDYPRSTIGKCFPFISKPLERHFGHRGFTHSLLGWLLITLTTTLLAMGITILLKSDLGTAFRLTAAFSIGYASHLLLDMMNPRGIQLFWPNKARDIIFKGTFLQIEAGSKSETIVFAILVVLMVAAFPISKVGMATSLRWLLATSDSAIAEFKTLTTQAFVTFDGTFTTTKAAISGQAEILDVRNQQLIVRLTKPVMPGIYTLSSELTSDILAKTVHVVKTKTPITIERIIFEGKMWADLLNRIPKNALVSGTIYLPQGFVFSFSLKVVSELGVRRLDQKNGTVILTFADKALLQGLMIPETYSFETQRKKIELNATKFRLETLPNQVKDLAAKLKGVTDTAIKGQLQLQRFQLQNELELLLLQVKVEQEALDKRKLLFAASLDLRS